MDRDCADHTLAESCSLAAASAGCTAALPGWIPLRTLHVSLYHRWLPSTQCWQAWLMVWCF